MVGWGGAVVSQMLYFFTALFTLMKSGLSTTAFRYTEISPVGKSFSLHDVWSRSFNCTLVVFLPSAVQNSVRIRFLRHDSPQSMGFHVTISSDVSPN